MKLRFLTLVSLTAAVARNWPASTDLHPEEAMGSATQAVATPIQSFAYGTSGLCLRGGDFDTTVTLISCTSGAQSVGMGWNLHNASGGTDAQYAAVQYVENTDLDRPGRCLTTVPNGDGRTKLAVTLAPIEGGPGCTNPKLFQIGYGTINDLNGTCYVPDVAVAGASVYSTPCANTNNQTWVGIGFDAAVQADDTISAVLYDGFNSALAMGGFIDDSAHVSYFTLATNNQFYLQNKTAGTMSAYQDAPLNGTPAGHFANQVFTYNPVRTKSLNGSFFDVVLNTTGGSLPPVPVCLGFLGTTKTINLAASSGYCDFSNGSGFASLHIWYRNHTN